VALIARHDEGGPAADRTEAADDQPVDARLGHQEAGAVVETVAVIIARIIAVAPDDDVGVGRLFGQQSPLEWAFEHLGHGNLFMRAAASGRRRSLLLNDLRVECAQPSTAGLAGRKGRVARGRQARTNAISGVEQPFPWADYGLAPDAAQSS